MSRLFLVAGEASGDLHGSLLARALKDIEPEIELAGVGGAAMEAAGVDLVYRSEEMAVTGLWEVLRHLPRLARLLKRLDSWLREYRPDALIAIDYPDFNIRLAARAKGAGVPVVYYISPQVWAWRQGRIAQLAKWVRRMIVIFPFEEEIYRSRSVPVTYVGHPLVDRTCPSRSKAEVRRSLGLQVEEHLIVLLPGSRSSEVERILPVLLDTRERLLGRKDLRWVIAMAPGLEARSKKRLGRLRVNSDIVVRSGETIDLLFAADLAITASGTATLEAALLGTPMIVVYRLHPLTWHLARRLVRVDHVAMANILAGERVVPEFLQSRVRPDLLADEVVRWIDDPSLRDRTGQRLLEAAASLGEGGASRRAAETIFKEIRSL